MARISTVSEPDKTTDLKCLVYSMDRVLNQLKSIKMICVHKWSVVLALYPFLSLCFSQKLKEVFQQDTESMILQLCFLEISPEGPDTLRNKAQQETWEYYVCSVATELFLVCFIKNPSFICSDFLPA